MIGYCYYDDYGILVRLLFKPISFPLIGVLCPRCRSGRCATVNKCYPYFKLFKFDVSEQWVMGTYDTCKFSGPTRSYVSACPAQYPLRCFVIVTD